jgi:hypothetical protein
MNFGSIEMEKGTAEAFVPSCLLLLWHEKRAEHYAVRFRPISLCRGGIPMDSESVADSNATRSSRSALAYSRYPNSFVAADFALPY